MDLKTRVQLAVVTRQMEVKAARDRLSKEIRESDKEKRLLPRSRRDQLDAEILFARRNHVQAVISLEAVAKFPPLSWR